MPARIESYVHNSVIGVLVEITYENEGSSRSKEFLCVAKDIAMHIAASRPAVVGASDLSEDLRNNELSYTAKSLEGLSNAEKEEKLKEFNKLINERFCLLHQAFVKEPELSVGEKLAEVSSLLGDKIEIKRFIRWEAK